jgi:hypothetical protein
MRNTGRKTLVEPPVTLVTQEDDMKLCLLEEVYNIFWKTVLSWELRYKSVGKDLPFRAGRAYGGVAI